MARTNRILLASFFVCLPGRALADARADLRDLRRGELPVRHEALGWTNDGRFAVRTLACSLGGTTACRAEVRIVGGAETEVHELLDVVEVYCDAGSPCEALPADVGVQFVHAEEAAMASLPRLTTTEPVGRLSEAFGEVAGEATSFETFVRAAHVEDLDVPGAIADLVVRAGRSRVRVASLSPAHQRIEGLDLVAVHPSPDGKRLAVVTNVGPGDMCWGPFWEVSVVVVDVAHVRSRVANSLGLRRYRADDLAGALAAFSDATREDPSQAFAWFNRAAVESRGGRLADAQASLARAIALDAGMARRACRDRDFDALRHGRPDALRCTD